MPRRTEGLQAEGPEGQSNSLVPAERIERRILVLREQKVMLDSDLAELYEVETKALNQAVRRNKDRFPEDFMFQLTPEETANLKSQFVTSSSGHGGRRRSRPYAFTQEGVAMLSSVLRSPRAVRVNIEIMRAFVRLRELFATHMDLAKRLDEHDHQLAVIFEALQVLMLPPPESTRRLGFHASEKKAAEKE